jgi:DAK2 domain fusion protein YloV
MQTSCGQYDPSVDDSDLHTNRHMTDISDTASSTRRTDGFLLRDFIRSATRALETNQDTINALNVFPVPDGDTGTNMVLTMRAIRDELDRNVDANPSITSARIARAALLGARGNSGLILAQYFKGLAEALVDGYDVSGEGFARGMRIASEIAYRAVPNPQEGTMLTVFRECAEASEAALIERPGLEHVMTVAADQAMDTVRRTPEMLQVLKDAGVVDSGGFGFAILLRSGVQALRGEAPDQENTAPPGVTNLPESRGSGISSAFLKSIEDEVWGYCTVFAVEGKDLDPVSVREQMDEIGRSAMVAGSDTLIKVHVHVEDPGAVLTAGLKLGALSNIDIHNMDEQAKEWASKQADVASKVAGPLKQVTTAVVSVALGTGFFELFKSAGFGSVVIVSGGDSMNPSTADILTAVEKAPSSSVIVLPNNKNVIGTAQQAAELSEKNVTVIQTRSMQAGLAALLEFAPEREIEKNSSRMEETQSTIRSGSVSVAARAALLDGVAVKRGQHMGVLDEKLVAAGNTSIDVLKQMLTGQVDDESLLTLYSGAKINGDALRQTSDALAKSLDGVEIETQSGGQPDYDFLLSIE